jgi:predicted outer membrane repeat protein
MNFINNTARLSGAAIYASDLHGCSWFQNLSNISSIFNDSYDNSPFFYKDNSVTDDTEIRNARLATSPLNISAVAEVDRVQPGELVRINLSARDQLGNYREAVWSLTRPGEEGTILGALPASQDQYTYPVPSVKSLGKNESVSEFNITLTFSLLRTLAQSTSVILTVDPNCHPGYMKSVDGLCVILPSRTEILRDSSDNRNVYIREGSYMWATESNSVAIHITLPSYLKCTPEGRLSGCLYEFDDESLQCTDQRSGIMCGKCNEGYSITLDLQSCHENEGCWQGLLVFLILCVAVVVASFLIMFFNVQVPNELKGFLFYAQVIGLVFRQFESIRQVNSNGSDPAIQFASTLSNLLGFSLPIPLCISEILEAHWVVLLSFVSPILALLTIVIYAIA